MQQHQAKRANPAAPYFLESLLSPCQQLVGQFSALEFFSSCSDLRAHVNGIASAGAVNRYRLRAMDGCTAELEMHCSETETTARRVCRIRPTSCTLSLGVESRAIPQVTQCVDARQRVATPRTGLAPLGDLWNRAAVRACERRGGVRECIVAGDCQDGRVDQLWRPRSAFSSAARYS